MSYIDDKMEIANATSSSGKARQLLKKHLHYKDGTPRFKVVEVDKIGPVVIETTNRMDGVVSRWNRSAKHDADYWFEKE